jgi:hypothetical protein
MFQMEVSDKSLVCDKGTGRRASYDFGIVSDTMLLATSSVIMDRLLEDGDRDATADSESGMRANSSRKRKRSPNSRPQRSLQEEAWAQPIAS